MIGCSVPVAIQVSRLEIIGGRIYALGREGGCLSATMCLLLGTASASTSEGERLPACEDCSTMKRASGPATPMRSRRSPLTLVPRVGSWGNCAPADQHPTALRGTSDPVDAARGAGQQPCELPRSQDWIVGTRAGNAAFVPLSPQHVAEPLSDSKCGITAVASLIAEGRKQLLESPKQGRSAIACSNFCQRRRASVWNRFTSGWRRRFPRPPCL